MQKSYHAKRLKAQLARQVATLMNNQLVSQFKGLTVSYVELSKDHAFLKVFFTVLKPEEKDLCLQALNDQKKAIRYQLGQTLKLRIVPELQFAYDTVLARALEMEALLKPFEADFSESCDE